MISKITGCLVLVFVLTSGTVFAEQLLQIPPGMRLSQGGWGGGIEASQNAIITPIKPADLPDTVMGDVGAVLQECTGSMNALDSIRAYAWTSDKSSTNNLPPNYIVDFNGVTVDPTLSLPSCKKGPICNDEGCLVYGFTAANTNDWRRDFELRATYLSFANADKGDGVNHQTQIIVFSNKSDCTKNGGLSTDKGCLRKLSWRTLGLSLLDPPSQ